MFRTGELKTKEERAKSAEDAEYNFLK